MREELGVTPNPARVASLRRGACPVGARWRDFYCERPSSDEDFVLTEGERYARFAPDEALSLPDLAPYAREDLLLFRDCLVQGYEPAATG